MSKLENYGSWLDILTERAELSAEKDALVFVRDSGETEHITYGQLDQKARALGAYLQNGGYAGERIIIALPTAIDYVVMFFGILYGGALPVTVYPANPKNASSMSRLKGIIVDSEPALILTHEKDASPLKDLLKANPDYNFKIQIIEEPVLSIQQKISPPKIDRHDIAFLQYTSGSTSSPKGVMVSHYNLMHNCELLATGMGFGSESIVASWLPLHHDMGLIGKILCSIYADASCYFMAPLSFIKKPYLWLKMVSDYGCTISGAPNFAYDQCVERISEEEKKTLDLKNWIVAWNGSEPTSVSSMNAFYEAFKSCGLRKDAIQPCYGLAEGTLLAVSKKVGTRFIVSTFDRDFLGKKQAVERAPEPGQTDSYLSHGIVLDERSQLLEVVDPETRQVKAEGEVGEIWLSSDSNALGYWRKPEETERIFHATIAGQDDLKYLKTGDLGFLFKGELYISGRIKDIFIVNGQNVYPQDIEKNVEDNYGDSVGRCALFSAQEDEEKGSLLIEISRTIDENLDYGKFSRSIAGRISLEFGLQIAAINYVKPGKIMRTTSGKIQRRANRAELAAGGFEILYAWRKEDPKTTEAKATPAVSLKETCLSFISDILKIPLENLDPEAEIGELGFTSLSFTTFVNRMNETFNLELTPSMMFEFPDVASFLIHLEENYSEEIQSLSAPLEAAPELIKDEGTVVRENEPIAVIGMDGRMPGSANLEEFWENLSACRDLIGEVPENRWDSSLWPQAQKRGGFMPDVDQFDALFFKLTPEEVEHLDPQQRLFLETSWNAIEDAGYPASELSGSRTGVFAGVSTGDYRNVIRESGAENQGITATGTANSNVPNRVSYFFNFHGPSEAVDTACSSSLTAMHRAIQSLKSGECDQALAGGVSALLHPELYTSFQEAGMLSSNERCNTFDRDADGYVRGEGVGVVFLKPLSRAIQDGDHIYGLIPASAVNHGGKVNNLTTPNPRAQAELLSSTYRDGGLNPESISYLEAHGTGTNLGDPIEINGLKKAFAELNQENGQALSGTPHVGLGSVKTNIGHLEAAAGVAGVLKILLALKAKRLPGMPHFENLNPQIKLEGSPFYLTTETRNWSASAPRRAGVSSFGFGGANAHIVIEEYVPARKPMDVSDDFQDFPALIVLSARKKEQLWEQAQRLLAVLDQPEMNLRDLAYTLQLGREAMGERLVFSVRSSLELKEKLKDPQASGLQGQAVRKNAETISASEIRERIKAGDADFLASAWARGARIDWNILYETQGGKTAERPARLSLPTFPFSKKRYWVQSVGGRVHVGSENQDLDTVYLGARWEQAEICLATKGREVGAEAKPLVFFIGRPAEIARAGTVDFSQFESVFLEAPVAGGPEAARSVQDLFLAVFGRVRSIFKDRNVRKQKVLVLVPEGDSYFRFAPLVGLLKTATLENPGFEAKLLQVGADVSETGLLEILISEIQGDFSLETEIRYRGLEQREVMGLTELEAPTHGAFSFSKGGVYWLTGGLGGLGRIFAEFFVKGEELTIILSGRSELNQESSAALSHLRKKAGPGTRVEYMQGDVSRSGDVRRILDSIQSRFGGLQGLIHSAGNIRDAFILNKTPEQIQEVFQPKVDAVLALDEATANLPLDFFLMFSSLAGVIGNPGQGDYAGANAFLDAFAEHRNELLEKGLRKGRTISIAWPLWETGGMQLDERSRDILRDELGIVPTETSVGLKAFADVLNMASARPIILRGDGALIRERIQKKQKQLESTFETVAVPVSSDTVELNSRVMGGLKELFQEVTKIPVGDVDESLPLEDFGLNSVMVVRFNQKFESIFGRLSRTLLYEYQTLEELCSYFVLEHTELCRSWVGSPAVSKAKEIKTHIARPAVRRVPSRAPVSYEGAPIAVIGISGRYPQARNLEQYWRNLEEGRDSVTEIPRDRWDWEDYFHEDRKEAGKLGKTYGRWGGFIDGFNEFDPLFFNISPREARNIDPQERLFLEESWSCIEDAGYTRESLAQYSVGVFAGITKTGFELYGKELPVINGFYPHTSFSSLANRVSYFFNFHGPSMPIDTMCSSSLTALHEACEHIRRGECEVALSGGVNIYTHPLNYIGLSTKQFLADDGRCRSFGEGGTGFVPAEGVGVLLLKPLERAIADGDVIHGVIRGSAINHDGKTNGYTVPNPNAQADLIRTGLDRAGVTADMVSYVEAHGTGTSLGDPIEITGLTKAYRQDTNQNGFCTIGSVKSNIGHGEAAAGVAGVTKILLQMKHGQIAPSLHSNTLNSNIDFEQSPFRVQQELSPWKRPVISGKGEEREIPRFAAISSFGAGGANAHLILEEFQTTPGAEIAPGEMKIIPISAKNEERLKAYALTLSEFLKGAQGLNLSDLAFTFQTGREAMESRAVFLCRNLKELEEALELFLNDEADPERLLEGETGRSKGMLRWFSEDEELRDAVTRWCRKGELKKLGELWVQGSPMDWNLLYGEGETPRRISLPTYSFAGERYWVTEEGVSPFSGESGRIGPLLKGLSPRASLDSGQGLVFEAILNAEHPLLKEHLVYEKPVFPGTGYIEMMLEAVAHIFPGENRALSNVTWVQPIVLPRGELPLRLKLQGEGAGFLFQVCSLKEGGEVLHAQALLGENEAERDAEFLEVETLRKNLGELWAQDGGDGRSEFYENYRRLGVNYGNYFQRVVNLWSRESEALGLLELPGEFRRELNSYQLHPVLLDAALQCAGAADETKSRGALLPFSMGRVERIAALEERMFVYVKKTGEGKFNLALLNPEGRLSVKIFDFRVRPLEDPVNRLTFTARRVREQLKEAALFGSSEERTLIIHRDTGFGMEALLAEKFPHSVRIQLGERNQKIAPGAWMLDLRDGAGLQSVLAETGELKQVFFLGGLYEGVHGEDYESLNREEELSTLSLFRAIRALIDGGYGEKTLSLTVLTQNTQEVLGNEDVGFNGAGLVGLVKSLAKEFPLWAVRSLDLDSEDLGREHSRKLTLEAVLREPADPRGNNTALRANLRYVEKVLPHSLQRSETPHVRENGVYVILGGAGGLGYVTGETFIKRYGAQVIWLGRSPLNAAIQSKIDALAEFGRGPVYIQADATDLVSMGQALQEIKSRFGPVHGVIHSAIVLRDKTLRNMDEQRFRESLDPKTKGSFVLAEVFRNEDLDWMLFYSSLQSFVGSAGQSNYAAGCTFKDALALRLRKRVNFGVFVINWGYWGEVGIVATDEYRQQMEKRGVGSLEAHEGMEVLERVFADGGARVICLKAGADIQRELGVTPDEYLQSLPAGSGVELSDLLKALPSRSEQLTELFDFNKAHVAIEKYSVQGLRRALDILLSGGGLRDEFSLNEFMLTAGVQEKYRRLVQEIFMILARAGVLLESVGRYRRMDRNESNSLALDLEKEGQEILRSFPGFKSHIPLLRDCLFSLPEILRGEILSTDVIFPGAAMTKVEGLYKGNPIVDYFNRRVADLTESYVRSRRKNLKPGEKIRIFEVGAGTGGTSALLFQVLKPHQDVLEYVYTDLSRSFLMHAETNYRSIAPYLRPELFNVSESPAAQGFETGVYDIVLGTNVLHATANMGVTMDNVKILLKRDGLALVNEMSSVQTFSTLTFGLLDGWWMYADEEIRMPGSPGLSPRSWENLLYECGYKNVSLVDGDTGEIGQQVIAAESDGNIRQQKTNSGPGSVNDIMNEEKNFVDTSALFGERNKAPESTPARQAVVQGSNPPAPQKVKAKIASVDSESFVVNALLDCIGRSLQIPTEKIQQDRPLSELGVDSIIGVDLVQKVNRELALTLNTTVLFDYPTVSTLKSYILENHGASLNLPEAETVSAPEPVTAAAPFATIPQPEVAPAPARVQAPTPAFTQKVETFVPQASSASTMPQASIAPFEGGSGYRKVLLSGPGNIEGIQLVEQDGEMTPGENEVLVATKAFSLNFGDLLCVKGLYPSMPAYPFTPGFEAAGVVLKTGSGVRNFRAGDEVITIGGPELGQQAGLIRLPESQLLRKPDFLSHGEASSLPAVLLTVIEIFRKARPGKQESMLIQTAAGGIGLLAVQLARYLGVNVIATAGSKFKLDYLSSLGVEHLINYQEQDFEAEVNRITAGRGVDVVLNTLSGENIQKGINCLSRRGRYVEIAMTAIKSAKQIDLSGMSNNQSYFSVDLRKLGLEEPEYLTELWEESCEYLKAGAVSATIGKTFSFGQLKEAYSYMENRNNIGKIVINVDAPVAHIPSGRKETTRRPAKKYAGEVAVVGMSGAFGDARNLDEFWESLRDGKSLIREVPKTRWDSELFFDSNPDAKDKTYCKWGGFLKEVDKFDPLFFNISAMEAENMDPQQRIFLEHSWKAIEDSGMNPRDLYEQRCGVFVGAASSDYASLQNQGREASSFWGHATSVIASRISYFLNLKGPAVAVDTACSSSLVALHMGVQSLLNGESDSVITGGVFLQATPEFYIYAGRAHMLSPDGNCYAFDERANGFVPGEGVGALYLKRLEDAERDGDHIYGLIKGSRINQDGTTNGLTAPSALSQKGLELDVYKEFDLNPESIQLVEAHGTGTALGDPIEFRALNDSFREFTSETGYCALGSVKTNIGHAASAAGVAGLIKILLSMKHGQIPASLNFEKANPAIDLENSPFYVNQKIQDWPNQAGEARRAALSSFGFSGTNAHVVVEDYPARSARTNRTGKVLIPLSARNQERLVEYAKNLADFIERNPALNLDEAAWTLQTGREAMKTRVAFLVETAAELRGKLEAFASGEAGNWFQAEVSRDKGGAVIRTQDELIHIAELWVQGGELGPEGLYDTSGEGARPGRISLPVYPFARESYWPHVMEEETVHYQAPVWREQLTAPRGEGYDFEPLAILLDWDAGTAARVKEGAIYPLRYGSRKPGDEAAKSAELAFKLLAGEIRELTAQRHEKERQILVIIPRRNDSFVYAPLAGLFKTMVRENPELKGKIVELPVDANAKDILRVMDEEFGSGRFQDVNVRYDEKARRTVQELENLSSSDFEVGAEIRTGGVYWITGGLGGLGKQLVRHFSGKEDVKIILSGRSAWDEGKKKELKELREVCGNNLTIDYLQADVGDKTQTAQVVQMILKRFGRLDGVVHSAGLTRDGLLINKSDEDIEAVFRGKVAGTMALDEATKNVELDFLVLFSSIAAVAGNAGQAEYAGANSFLDAFAQYRTELVKDGKRFGQTVSINWCAWKQGGMRQSQELQDYLKQSIGLESLETSEALNAFDRALQVAGSRVVVVKGAANSLQVSLKRRSASVKLEPELASRLKEPETPAQPVSTPTSEVDDSALKEKIKKIFHEITRIPEDKLDDNASYKEFGVDSLMATKLTRRFEDNFGKIPQTLLYEYLTINELCEFFAKQSTEQALSAS